MAHPVAKGGGADQSPLRFVDDEVLVRPWLVRAGQQRRLQRQEVIGHLPLVSGCGRFAPFPPRRFAVCFQ